MKRSKSDFAKAYFWNFMIAIDQLVNTIFAGDPDETISSRMGKWLNMPKNTKRYKFAHVLCLILHALDENHCKQSIEEDEGDRGIVD